MNAQVTSAVRVLCVINRQSRDGAATGGWAQLASVLSAAEVNYQVVEISRQGLAEAIAHSLRIEPANAIIGIGGDGTHLAVLNALKQVERQWPSLALPPYIAAPFGTGNNVAKSLGLEPGRRSLDTVLSVLYQGSDRRLDLGSWENSYFADALSIGLDPQILTCRQELQDRLPAELKRVGQGYLGYFFAGLMAIQRQTEWQCEIVLDGMPWYTGRFTCLVLNNTRVYGGIFDPTPNARDDDGRLDIWRDIGLRGYLGGCIFNQRAQPGWVRRLGRRRMSAMGLAEASFRDCRIILEPPAPVQVDGEFQGVRQEVRLSAVPATVTVRTPVAASTGP